MPQRANAQYPGILLTGATGFLGGEVLARLLGQGDRQIYALVRARDQVEADRRLRETIAGLLGTADPWSRRAVAVPGDLCTPGLGLDEPRREWLAERVSQVIHCAASVSFDLGLEESRAINVEGTRRVLDFAQLCNLAGGLDCFTHVSTAYVAGTHRGRFTEADAYRGQDFRNPYERSKLEAELVVRQRSDSVPVQVLRPSIVVGDSRSGWTASFNVLYWPLLAFRRGTYPVLPARRSAPVDVVPVDYVADSVVALAGQPGTVYHLVAGDRASTVGEVVELACEHLDAKRPRLLPPRLYRRTLHQVLLRFGDARRRRRLRRSEQFFPYFDMKVGYDDAEARRALAPHSIEAPPLASYFERLIDYAHAAEWGRRPLPRHRAARAPGSGHEHRLPDRGTRLDRGVRPRAARVSSRRPAPR